MVYSANLAVCTFLKTPDARKQSCTDKNIFAFYSVFYRSEQNSLCSPGNSSFLWLMSQHRPVSVFFFFGRCRCSSLIPGCKKNWLIFPFLAVNECSGPNNRACGAAITLDVARNTTFQTVFKKNISVRLQGEGKDEVNCILQEKEDYPVRVRAYVCVFVC